jgi:uncharacterized iron-regulated protein
VCWQGIIFFAVKSFLNFSKAQAIKDATMAYSIVKYRKDGQTLVHFNGSYHSDRYMSIIWYLDKYHPGLKITTITTVQQDDIRTLNDKTRGYADFVLVTPASMTRTNTGEK